jgi:hypothetical protein
MRHKKLLVVLSILFSVSCFPETYIPPGPVSGTWGVAGSPFYIQGDITIPDDSTLIIEPGVSVIFEDHYALNVQGRLLAVGTASDMISFTVDDTTGFYDPDTTSGGWNGIQFIETPVDNDTSKIVFCSLQYGKAVDTIQPGNSGGAVCIFNFSKVIISNCLISYNSAGGLNSPSGGGLFLFYADIILTGNEISHNSALGGGAILIWESDIVFIGNSIKYNVADQNGGGIWIGGESNVHFNSDTISNNSAGYSGGGIVCWQTTNTTLTSVVVKNNTADWGGGVGLYSCSLQIDSSFFTDNGSTHIAGGLGAEHSNVIINNSSFERDTAFIFGGAMGIYFSELNVTNSNLTDNAAGLLGGGIHSDGSNITLTNITFERDTTDDSGGAVFTWQCDMTITDCDFIDNSSINGGAVCSDSCYVFINNSSFNENTSLWGGGVLGNRGQMNLMNCSFNNNVSDHGGAVNTNNSNLQIDSCIFYQNISQIEGGGLMYNADTSAFVSTYHLEIDNSVFEENSSVTQSGAILAESGNAELPLVNIMINRSEFLNNHAQRIGALRITNVPDFTVSNSKFIGNTSELSTAACTFAGFSKGSVYNCLFEHNSTGSGSSGGAGVSNFAEVSFVNCTFANNKSGSGGGIQLRRGSIVTAVNNILWGNHPDQIALNAVNDTSECILYSYYNDIQFGVDSIHISDSVSVINWGNGNMDSDPLFVDTLNNDFHLQDVSPCIAAGIDSIEIAGIWYYCPVTDIEGNARPNPDGTMPDMGAYESQYPVRVSNQDSELPTEYALYPNYPNPFNPVTTISYCVPVKSYISLKVFNVLGRELLSLVDAEQSAGRYQVKFNAVNLASGVYFYRLEAAPGGGQAGSYTETRKMILLR